MAVSSTLKGGRKELGSGIFATMGMHFMGMSHEDACLVELGVALTQFVNVSFS